jgi:hypothetical protein
MAEPEQMVLPVEATEPIALEEVDEPGPEPPPDWDAGAHDEADVRDGVKVTEKGDG